MIAIVIIISLLLIIYGVFGLVSQSKNSQTKYPIVIPSLILGGFFLVVFSLIIRIDAQQVGVLVKPTGVSDEELHTGWHIVMPWNEVHKMDKTVWVYTCTNATGEGSKDHSDAIWAPHQRRY